MNELKEDLSTKTAKMNELKEDLSIKTAKMNELKEDLGTKTAKMNELEEDLSTKTAKMNELEEDLSTKEIMMNDTMNILNNLKKEYINLENILDLKEEAIMQLRNTFNIKYLKKDTAVVQNEIIYDNLDKLEIDIITVTYNSAKWIDNYILSIRMANRDNIDLVLTIVDNNSSDETVKLLKKYQQSESFSIHIIESEENLGFGRANNMGVRRTDKKYIFFLNIDTELFEDTFTEFVYSIKESESNIGAWELKQVPYEHPKYYNPITFETRWFSGAAVILRRDVFEEVGGFDSKIFMYTEDVDLSWRIRNEGYIIKYLHKSFVTHHSYTGSSDIKPLQFYNSIYNNMMLRYRYGNFLDIFKGYLLLINLLRRPEIVEGQREKIKNYIKNSFIDGLQFRGSLFNKYKNIDSTFYGFDYERAKNGAFYINEKAIVTNGPLISIIVRTHKRKDVLRETLVSLRNQTYKNFEVVIVEDGKNTAYDMLIDEFPDLDIIYTHTGKNVGRSRVGNIALGLCTGKFINFLDDDDLFYPDHLIVLVKEIFKDPDLDAVYSTAFETPIIIDSNSPYSYEVLDKKVVLAEEYSRSKLIQMNLFPIQSVLFSRKLYEKHGGFNVDYDYLEDWELWLRYFKGDVKIKFVNKTTSIYRVPSKKKIAKSRNILLKKNYKEINSLYTQEQFSNVFTEKINYDLEVKSYIDNIYFGENKRNINIGGWAFINIETIDSKKVVPIILIEINEKNYSIKPKKILRNDVAEFFNNSKYSNSGFELTMSLPFEVLGKINSISIILEFKEKYYFAWKIENEQIIEQHVKQNIVRRGMRKLKNVIKKKLLDN